MKKIIKFILVILWMGLIFFFSSRNAYESSKQSNNVIIKTAEVLAFKDLSEDEKTEYINKYSFIVRKNAHFIIYFILGILLLSLLEEYNLKNIFLKSLLIAILYSITDEFHQYFVPGRTSKIMDIIIDSVASLCGISIYYLLKIKKTKKVN